MQTRLRARYRVQDVQFQRADPIVTGWGGVGQCIGVLAGEAQLFASNHRQPLRPALHLPASFGGPNIFDAVADGFAGVDIDEDHQLFD